MIKTTPDGDIYMSVTTDEREHEAFVEYEDAEAIAALVRRDDIEEMACSVAERYPDIYEKLTGDDEMLDSLLEEIETELKRHEDEIRETIVMACIFRKLRD